MSGFISISSLSAPTSFTIPTFVKIEGLEEKEIKISENIDKPMQSLKQEQARAREIAEKGRKEDWNPGGDKTTGICAAFGCKAVDHIINHGDQEAIPPLIVTAPTPEMKFLVMNLVRAIYQSLGTGETYQDAKINEKGRALVNKSCQAFISLMTTHTGIKVVGHYPSQGAGIDFSEACPMESVDKFIEDISKTNIGNHHLLFFRSPELHLTAGHIVYINFEKGVIGDGADGTMWKIPSEFKELFVPVLKAFIKENYGSGFQQVSALALEKSYQPCRIPLCMKKISLYTNLLFNVAKKEGIRPAGAIACELFTGSDFVQGMKRRKEKVVGTATAIKNKGAFFFNGKFGSQTVKQQELCKACKQGDIESVKKLIGWGADINTPVDGMPPVTAAVKSGNLNLVKLLVNAGANINPVPFEKNEGLFIHSFEIENELVSPMKMACYDSLPEMVFYLLEKGAIPKPEHLVTACNGGQECIDSPDGPTYQDKKTRIKIVEMLLTNGIDPNGIKTSSRSPIGEVISYYDIDTVQLLLKAGAKPHLNKAFMAFREAWDNVEKQDKAKKIIRLFLDAGADLRDLHELWFSTFEKMDIATPEELDLIKKLERSLMEEEESKESPKVSILE